MAEEENTETIRPEFPTRRVKRIMKLNKDINMVNSKVLSLVSCSAELFLHFLAKKSVEVTIEKKWKIVKLEHMRVAVKRHQSTSEFLLDSLPMPSQPSDSPTIDQNRTRPVSEKPLPTGTRRIDDFFHKPANEAPIQIDNDEL